MTAFDPQHADHGHHGDHPPHLAHHFDTPEQQFDSAKVGMWAFLATEILMFGGLFCAYAVYRYNNPDVFRYAEHHLDWELGATNTIVLLASSLTMALAVRAAQLGQQTYLKLMLAMTLLGGVGFMVIKTIEYTGKFNKGFFPGRWSVYDRQNNPEEFAKYLNKVNKEERLGKDAADEGEQGDASAIGDGGGEDHSGRRDVDGPESGAPEAATTPADQQPPESRGEEVDSPRKAPAQNSPFSLDDSLAVRGPGYIDPNAGTGDAALHRPAFNTLTGTRAPVDHDTGGHAAVEYTDLSSSEMQNVKAFFGIYYMMTGLHGVHVIVGMGLIGWILIKSFAGTFGPQYFTPVDLVGLYWHIVDLIWIFLFPLLYLIH
jgi:cytochrome c oxidase subunit 3